MKPGIYCGLGEWVRYHVETYGSSGLVEQAIETEVTVSECQALIDGLEQARIDIAENQLQNLLDHS